MAMSNYLKMEKKQIIVSLRKLGWSFRRIQRETGVRRETISKYVLDEQSKAAKVPTGSEGEIRPNCLSKSRSQAVIHHSFIEAGLKQGLTCQRIYQDLCSEHAYAGSYDSVKRYAKKLQLSCPETCVRIETAPGEEAQVDFGKSQAPTLDPATGTYKIPWIFKMTLCFSRHSYEEAVWKQDIETFIRCHERAFESFGGVTKVVRLDNLKAGVARACLYDPEINKVYASYARHAGFTPLACKPNKPEHKGKVERGIGYTKNAIKCKRFEGLEQVNAYLRHWNETVARLRIHGTTKQQVWKQFVELEKNTLQPLAEKPYDLFEVAIRKVHPDGYIEVKKAFYSVPHQYMGREVEVHFTGHILRVYCDHSLIAVHRRTDKVGHFHTHDDHLPKHKSLRQEGFQRLLLAKAGYIGESALGWAQEVIVEKGPLAYRLIQGMLQLTRSYPKEQVDGVCRTTREKGIFKLRILKRLLQKQTQIETTAPELMQDHELIRPLSQYAQLTQTQEDYQ
jgi:transposase